VGEVAAAAGGAAGLGEAAAGAAPAGCWPAGLFKSTTFVHTACALPMILRGWREEGGKGGERWGGMWNVESGRGAG